MIDIHNSVLTVNGPHAISNIEQGLTRLESISRPVDCLVNVHLDKSQFGGLGALLQLIITWARRNPRGQLRLHVTNQGYGQEQIERFAQTDHGLISMLMAHDITNRSGSHSLRAECLRHIKTRLTQMDSVEAASRGAKVLVLTADHTPFAFPATVYVKTAGTVYDPELRSSGGYQDLTHQILMRLKHGAGSRLPSSETMEALSIVLRELFQNTHHWARHDADGGRLSPSVRGIRAELYSHDPSVHEKMVADEPTLLNYIKSAKLRRTDLRQRLIEITVFDSGPGLAARCLRQKNVCNPTIMVEYDAVVDCLKTHFTTSSASHRGDGLHQVIRMLTQLNGFLRIRTGRLALYRDFVANPYNPNSDSAEPYLMDWSSFSRSPTLHASCEGTVLTTIFPVQYAS